MNDQKLYFEINNTLLTGKYNDTDEKFWAIVRFKNSALNFIPTYSYYILTEDSGIDAVVISLDSMSTAMKRHWMTLLSHILI